MKLLLPPSGRNAPRRGAALVLSFMVLLVLILILAQIKYSTATDARVARNEEVVLSMDMAIESAFLQVFEDLKADAESDAGGGGAGALGDTGANPGASPGTDPGAGGEGQSGPTDSHEDTWAKPQRTELNEIQLRILVQDEDSKFNLLSVLTEDEDEADKAMERLTRVIEWSRKGTSHEINGAEARNMATTMRDYMLHRGNSILPRPELLSDDEQEGDLGLPLSLREFMALDPELFPEDLFRDFIDQDGVTVHSLGSFLTVWSSVGTLEESRSAAEERGASEDGGATPPEGSTPEPGSQNSPDSPGEAGQNGNGQGNGQEGAQGNPAAPGGSSTPDGWVINVNTAPPAVLHALLEGRDLPYRFWDDVVRYRNEPDEDVEENDDPPLDEYGREIVVHQFFTSVDQLSEIDGWESIEPDTRAELQSLLKTQSQVFSIFITARKATGEENIDPTARSEDIEREEADWHGLVRTVHAVVWRHVLGEGDVEIVPIVRWKVIDYVPYEVLDFPEARDRR